VNSINDVSSQFREIEEAFETNRVVVKSFVALKNEIDSE
ncbi:MAG: hypothetical protein ACI90V_012659, partial [Bacillariaceae sp.]|jgi:hypothetical protein